MSSFVLSSTFVDKFDIRLDTENFLGLKMNKMTKFKQETRLVATYLWLYLKTDDKD